MSDMIGRLYAQENFEWNEFTKADTMLQPAYTWGWNAPLDRAGIRKQLDGMKKAGIHTVYILPEPKEFRKNNEKVHIEQEYLSDEFFEEVRYAAEYAMKIGITFWMYDEGGWPSGAACGQVIAQRPELCRKSINKRPLALKKGDRYVPGEQAIAAFYPGKIGKQVVVQSGEMMDDDTELTEYFVVWHGGMVVDSLDEDVGRVFVESTHVKYEKALGDLFGTKDENGRWIPGSNKIPMMFTDEPGTGAFAWPRNFEARFQERYGYDIAPYVAVIANPEAEVDAAGLQARMDYRELTGEMFRDNYFVPIHEWCRRNNVLSTGHLDIDHRTDGCVYHCYGSVLSLLRELDVPGVDVIWRQIDIPANGKQPCYEGNGFFPRFAASAAAQNGGKYAVSESFAVYGAGLTGEEMEYVINFQLVRGINLFNMMSMTYGKIDAVPVVMRPNFISEMPGYENLRAVNDYAARAGYLMQLGMPGVRTALYIPNRDIWADGGRRSRAVEAFDELGRSLEEQQVEFDVIDDEAIRMAKREGDTLRVGNAVYSCVLAPECEFMPEDVKKILNGMSREAIPAVQGGCRALRVSTRILPDGGVMYMLFNESAEEQRMDIELPGTGNVYRLYPDGVRAEKASARLKGLVMRAGEAQFYLCTDAVLESAQTPLACGRVIAEIIGFSIRRKRDVVLDAVGIHERNWDENGTACELGCWTERLGADFSGEAVYVADVKLNEPLSAGQIYEIDLGKVECTATVSIDGKPIGIAWTAPKKVRFDGAIVGGKMGFRLEVEVANTFANRLNSEQPLSSIYEEDYLGRYQAQLAEFEQNAPAGGLYGPVVLSELR